VGYRLLWETAKSLDFASMSLVDHNRFDPNLPNSLRTKWPRTWARPRDHRRYDARLLGTVAIGSTDQYDLSRYFRIGCSITSIRDRPRTVRPGARDPGARARCFISTFRGATDRGKARGRRDRSSFRAGEMRKSSDTLPGEAQPGRRPSSLRHDQEGGRGQDFRPREGFISTLGGAGELSQGPAILIDSSGRSRPTARRSPPEESPRSC
jgi:hypothetical protein